MAMVKNPFNGNLNSNVLFSSIFNMIISQDMLTDNIKGVYGDLVSKFKVDGTLYGDTKLFYANDVLKSRPWLNDLEASNLLNINRPDDPKCQAITIDQFRQIDITVDNYLSKQAWGSEGAFQAFQSSVLGWVSETKRIYEATMFNSYVGTVEGAANKALVEVPIYDISATGEEKNRLEAETIAQYIADLLVNMKDVSRDFNDYKFLRSYAESDLMFIWNSKFINKIRKIDLPTIFHNDGLMDKFAEEILPERYFGHVSTSTALEAAVYDASTNPDGYVTKSGSTYTVKTAGTLRTLIETDVTVGGTTYHLFPADALPVGTTIAASGSVNILISETYAQCPDIICKIVHKNSFKFMSAFMVSTEFFNARSLTSNHYLTWGYSQPDYLRNYPIVVVEAD